MTNAMNAQIQGNYERFECTLRRFHFGTFTNSGRLSFRGLNAQKFLSVIDDSHFLLNTECAYNSPLELCLSYPT